MSESEASEEEYVDIDDPHNDKDESSFSMSSDNNDFDSDDDDSLEEEKPKKKARKSVTPKKKATAAAAPPAKKKAATKKKASTTSKKTKASSSSAKASVKPSSSTVSKDNVKKPSPQRKKPKSSPPKKATKKDQQQAHDYNNIENDSFDVILPASLGNNAGTVGGGCTIMVEVEEEDAQLLDYEGISGAIGRLQADNRSLILDLKGCQYHAWILPGPTAMVVSLSKGRQLKVESLTDEFATMVQTQNILEKLDAVVEGEMDETFTHKDENVNVKDKKQEAADAKEKAAEKGKNGSKDSKNTKKRRATTSSGTKKATPTGAPNKKRKTKSLSGK